MKLFFVGLLLVLISSPSFAATPPTCNFQDASSKCEIHLSPQELTIIFNAFEAADLKHQLWGPVEENIVAQVRAQQPHIVDNGRAPNH